jgi:succinate dehydrogenase/fumarate reductase flavoprotein subunit
MKQLETDIAIVGAGTAGLAAAIAATEKGAKVTIFEKASTTGGTGNMGMGPLKEGIVSDKLVAAIVNMKEAEALALTKQMLDSGTDPMKLLDRCRETMEVIGKNRYPVGHF